MGKLSGNAISAFFGPHSAFFKNGAAGYRLAGRSIIAMNEMSPADCAQLDTIFVPSSASSPASGLNRATEIDNVITFSVQPQRQHINVHDDIEFYSQLLGSAIIAVGKHSRRSKPAEFMGIYDHRNIER